ncbi:hypothetical protein BX589_101111 [Paraburkholderia fungorum]|nr:hypothetical protein BX589_101111 [Paraburkholderia fungorum]
MRLAAEPRRVAQCSSHRPGDRRRLLPRLGLVLGWADQRQRPLLRSRTTDPGRHCAPHSQARAALAAEPRAAIAGRSRCARPPAPQTRADGRRLPFRPSLIRIRIALPAPSQPRSLALPAPKAALPAALPTRRQRGSKKAGCAGVRWRSWVEIQREQRAASRALRVAGCELRVAGAPVIGNERWARIGAHEKRLDLNPEPFDTR